MGFFVLEIQVLEDNKKLETILTTELLMPTIKRDTMKIAGFSMCNIKYSWHTGVRQHIYLKHFMFFMFLQTSGIR